MRDRLELRAREPVAHCLMRRLLVPRIYFEAEWPGMPTVRIDVLALDRDGKGDAHVVEIRKNATDALSRVPALLRVKAPFRWIAYLRGTETPESNQALTSQEELFALDTSGRVGVIEISETLPNRDLEATIRLKAERFPTPTYEMAAKFSSTHEADVFIPD